ncbi:MAG: hypothetical protein ACREBQ_10605, partial [Nitrososphaerales archaeon]
DLKTLSEKTEGCLGKLQFQFIRNGTTSLVEYEIVKPCYFRIVIEPRKDLSVHNFLLPSISAKKGSTIDVRFDIDSDYESLKGSMERARLFLRSLVESLPEAPWKGLGIRDRGNEERRWKEAL